MTSPMDPTRSSMMPNMMALFCKMRLAMTLKIFLLFVMLSSTPWSVSLAWVMVSRCLCKSCKMLTPSSSVSSSVCLLCLMLSPALLMRSVVWRRRSLCAAEDADQWSPTRPSSALFCRSGLELDTFFTSLFSLFKSALYSLSLDRSELFFSGGRLRASRSMRRISASASDKSLLMSLTFCDLISPERLLSMPVFLPSWVDSSQYSRS
mmetsp:Transcript_34054/g.73734  ORF Transcript_34054/g.73734 Transcript_34054/m.73734 type:complete len:207 (+) Transcript_34054:1007-1627(+)